MNNKEKKSFTIPEQILKDNYKTYVKYNTVLDKLGCGSIAWFVAFFWCMILGITTPSFCLQCAEEQNINSVQAVGQRVRDLYNPVSNGWYVQTNPKFNGTNKLFKYKYDAQRKGKFSPRPMWYVNAALLLWAACWLTVVGAKQRHSNKMQEKAVETMLKMPFVGVEDVKTVKKLMKFAPDVIHRMAKENRRYFDTLSGADMYHDIVNNDTVRKMAVEIMMGYLDSHPQDAEKVIELCSKNAIPRKMVQDKMAKIRY